MIVLDTSALVAILSDEPERRAFNLAIEKAAARFISAASLLELKMVLFARFGPQASNAVDAFIARGPTFASSPSPRNRRRSPSTPSAASAAAPAIPRG